MANPDDTRELNRILMEIANLKSNNPGDSQPDVELARQESPPKVALQRFKTAGIGTKRIDRLHSEAVIPDRAVSGFQVNRT